MPVSSNRLAGIERVGGVERALPASPPWTAVIPELCETRALRGTVGAGGVAVIVLCREMLPGHDAAEGGTRAFALPRDATRWIELPGQTVAFEGEEVAAAVAFPAGEVVFAARRQTGTIEVLRATVGAPRWQPLGARLATNAPHRHSAPS